MFSRVKLRAVLGGRRGEEGGQPKRNNWTATVPFHDVAAETELGVKDIEDYYCG